MEVEVSVALSWPEVNPSVLFSDGSGAVWELEEGVVLMEEEEVIEAEREEAERERVMLSLREEVKFVVGNSKVLASVEEGVPINPSNVVLEASELEFAVVAFDPVMTGKAGPATGVIGDFPATSTPVADKWAGGVI